MRPLFIAAGTVLAGRSHRTLTQLDIRYPSLRNIDMCETHDRNTQVKNYQNGSYMAKCTIHYSRDLTPEIQDTSNYGYAYHLLKPFLFY